MRFVDHSKDGIIGEDDRVIIGDPNPDIYGNFNLTSVGVIWSWGHSLLILWVMML